MSLALLNAVASEKLHTGADVVALYNGIEAEEGNPEHIDSLSVIHLGEHLERLSAQELRKLFPHSRNRGPSSVDIIRAMRDGRIPQSGRRQKGSR